MSSPIHTRGQSDGRPQKKSFSPFWVQLLSSSISISITQGAGHLRGVSIRHSSPSYNYRLLLSFCLWTKNITCHFSTQRMLQPKSHQPLQPTKRTHTEGISGCKKQDACSKQLRCTSIGWFQLSWASCIFPNIEKHKNHNLRCIFFGYKQWSFGVCLNFFSKWSIYSGSSLTSWELFLRAIWEAIFPTTVLGKALK